MNNSVISNLKFLTKNIKTNNYDEFLANFINVDEYIKSNISNDNIIDDDRILFQSSRLIKWKVDLIFGICHHYGCAVWDDCDFTININKTTRYKLVGKKSTIDIIHYLFPIILDSFEKINRKQTKGMGHKVAFSFCDIMVNQFLNSLEQLKNDDLSKSKDFLFNIRPEVKTMKTSKFHDKFIK